MKKFEGRYEKICEETLFRFQQHGFLCGDHVKIKKNALSQECIKTMSEQVKALLHTAIKEEASFKVSYIKSNASESFSGPVGAPNVPGCIWADIYHEHAPGMFSNVLTVPVEILEKIEVEGMNGYPQYDRKLVRPNVVEPTADEVMLKQTDGKKRDLPKSNNKLAHSPKPKDGREGLTKPKKLNDSYSPRKENNLIFEGYINGKKSA